MVKLYMKTMRVLEIEERLEVGERVVEERRRREEGKKLGDGTW